MGKLSIILALIASIALSPASANAAFVHPSSSHQPIRIPSAVSSDANSNSNSQWRRYHPQLHPQQYRNSKRIQSIQPFQSTATKLNALPAVATTTAAAATTFGPAILKNTFARLHSDPVFVLSSVLLLSTFGIALERETTVGKALSAPLATMALALIVANFGIIPFSSPIYNTINTSLIPLAIPLLLFDSNLRRIVSDTGTLLLAFLLGAISTIIGTLVAYSILPLHKALGVHDGWRVGAALAARHIGGAINFVAVSETLDVGGSAVSAAIASDNVVVALYFGFLFYLAREGEEEEVEGKEVAEVENKEVDMPLDPEDMSLGERGMDVITMPTLAVSITVASCLVLLGKILTKAVLPSGTSALPLISILTVTAATLFPRSFSNLRATGTSIGIIFMQMFFAASGASGSIRLVLQSAPSLFVFSALQIAVHFLTLMGLGRGVFRLKPRELYLASNANVGGPTTAAAMATAKGWKRLILPALLVGILGYASATPIALLLGQYLKRMPLR